MRFCIYIAYYITFTFYFQPLLVFFFVLLEKYFIANHIKFKYIYVLACSLDSYATSYIYAYVYSLYARRSRLWAWNCFPYIFVYTTLRVGLRMLITLLSILLAIKSVLTYIHISIQYICRRNIRCSECN